MARLGRTRVQVATTAVILLGALAAPPDASAARATVVRVVDGDTVLLRTANGTTRLNLRGIDAPELGECFGASARRRLARLLPRRSRVTTSRGEIRRRGRSVNVSMVRGGFAVTDGRRPRLAPLAPARRPGRRDRQRARAARRVRGARGPWPAGVPPAPRGRRPRRRAGSGQRHRVVLDALRAGRHRRHDRPRPRSTCAPTA